jgi:glycine/sarcosine N-methyltransferase
MGTSPEDLYNDLAASYHLIFEDWDQSIARQAAVLGPLLEHRTGKASPCVLDCACGIGTQTLGVAQRGHLLVGSDLSRTAVERAKTEAQQRGLEIPFYVADMLDLSVVPESGFDAVLVADNALPHLMTQAELERALTQIWAKLGDSGVVVATLRDYDALIATRPSVQPPAFYVQKGRTRIVHQVWQWENNSYVFHLYITVQTEDGWSVRHFVSRYRALLRAELNDALLATGFTGVEWLEPHVTSYYQPIVVARKASAG